MSDTIAVMNKGRLEQVGDAARNSISEPKTRFVAGFLGAVNWIGAGRRQARSDSDLSTAAHSGSARESQP